MYTGKVIDCDVHHDWPTAEHLLPYLSEGWREYVTGPARMHENAPMIPMVPLVLSPHPTGSIRPEAFPRPGHAAASDYDLMKEQLLDPSNVERALLGYSSGEFIGALPNPYFAAEIARAANDWSIENWLERDDDRLYGTVLVATQLPEVAAAEIRRVGAHPRMAEVMLTAASHGRPFGHPVYHPIYEAACEMDLPVAIHVGGEAFPGHNVSPAASGFPSFYYETHILVTQGLQTHTTSMICHGVFEKYPSLRIALVEPGGVAWIPWLLWSMDASYKGLRMEVPWLKKHPSEYFHEHFRVTTQPLDSAPKIQDLVDVLTPIGAEDLLMYSSDYPHWDTDEVDHISRRLPAAWHDKVFRDNAIDFYRWPELKRDAAVASGAPAGV